MKNKSCAEHVVDTDLQAVFSGHMVPDINVNDRGVMLTGLKSPWGMTVGDNLTVSQLLEDVTGNNAY